MLDMGESTFKGQYMYLVNISSNKEVAAADIVCFLFYGLDQSFLSYPIFLIDSLGCWLFLPSTMVAPHFFWAPFLIIYLSCLAIKSSANLTN